MLFAASDGQIINERLSPDDGNANSLFTRVLLKHLGTPGQPLIELAKHVRDDVSALAAGGGKKQRPAFYDSTDADFFLAEGK